MIAIAGDSTAWPPPSARAGKLSRAVADELTAISDDLGGVRR
ncbi:hypothetical protein ACIBCN_31315 [Nocardia sp. NPDC051052]